VSAGDISYQLYVKERQQCKPFKYFVENVAPDMKDYYPVEEPAEFASGAVSNFFTHHE
jgi:polypeptide N-acetylgalactosaminyltransferase